MVALTQQAARRWLEAQRVDLAVELSQLSLRIAARALFGAELAHQAAPIGRALTAALTLLDRRLNRLLPLPLWVPSPDNLRLRRARAVLEGAVRELIAQRQRAPAAGAPPDLLGRLRQAQRAPAAGTDAPRLGRRALRDEVLTMLLAGHETTAHGLLFALWLLARHPEVEQRLHAEVERVLGGRPASGPDAARLELCQQVFQEALRLYPPVWLTTRQAAEDVVLGGRVRIRRREVVGLPQWVVHRDPRWWPEPLAFRPERFAREAPRPAPWTYFPFGGGRRACIGRSFALLEGTVVLATLSQQVRFEIDTRRPLHLLPAVTLRPAGGLPAAVRRAGSPARCS
ncbi:MAG: hypothetical protein KatS3mg102_1293 [Planctomycetota bacterium]|nr:MAG: hypothetical protein KatS3mg102_1293 [Planctomycetota bacterium]